MLIASAVTAVKGNLADKTAVQKALEKANFKSVRGDFKFGNNHMPIQSFYLQDVVKQGDDYVLKTATTIVKNDQDRFHDKCPMK
jgi:branched-chain amino acid transport system substrate-binding protein